MRISLKTLVVTFLIYLLVTNTFAQKNKEGKFIISGFVYGYTTETSKKMFKKDTQYKQEGNLQDVAINVMQNNESVSSTRTNATGVYEIKLAYGKIYTIEFVKPNYKSTLVEVDLSAIPKEVYLKNISFKDVQISMNAVIADAEEETPQTLGKLFFDTKQNFIDFESFTKSKKGIFSKDNPYNIIQHLKNAVEINKEQTIILVQKSLEEKKSVSETKEEASSNSEITKTPTTELGKLKAADIKKRELEIAAALKQLEADRLKAITPEELAQIAEREKQLNQAVSELADAKKMIETQKKEISMQRNLLLLSGLSLLLLGAFLYVLFKHNKDKKIANALLAEKTKKITDSINYAKKIQNSLLPNEALVKETFKDSFMLFKPKDIVSGDFPFYFKNGNNVYIAVADCTGHGVPGALLSIVGSLLLNEIVRYENLSASELIDKLHEQVVRTLRQGEAGGENERDGMDIGMCKINLTTGKMEFSGAHRPLFILRNNANTEIEEIKGDKFPIGGVQYKGRKTFSSFETVLNKKDRLFIFSDGITDQFGGFDVKPNKLGAKAIRKIIVDNGAKNIAETKNVLDNYYINWMGKQKQIDDVLVIGIEF